MSYDYQGNLIVCPYVSASSSRRSREASLSVWEIDDSSYWDAVCKLRLPAFSWLTHADRDSLWISSTMKIASAGKTDYSRLLTFDLLREGASRSGWRKERIRRWIPVPRSLTRYGTILLFLGNSIQRFRFTLQKFYISFFFFFFLNTYNNDKVWQQNLLPKFIKRLINYSIYI